eukprot:ANDGO_01795.mRNA.1 hypothetical protein
MLQVSSPKNAKVMPSVGSQPFTLADFSEEDRQVRSYLLEHGASPEIVCSLPPIVPLNRISRSAAEADEFALDGTLQREVFPIIHPYAPSRRAVIGLALYAMLLAVCVSVFIFFLHAIAVRKIEAPVQFLRSVAIAGSLTGAKSLTVSAFRSSKGTFASGGVFANGDVVVQQNLSVRGISVLQAPLQLRGGIHATGFTLLGSRALLISSSPSTVHSLAISGSGTVERIDLLEPMETVSHMRKLHVRSLATVSDRSTVHGPVRVAELRSFLSASLSTLQGNISIYTPSSGLARALSTDSSTLSSFHGSLVRVAGNLDAVNCDHDGALVARAIHIFEGGSLNITRQSQPPTFRTAPSLDAFAVNLERLVVQAADVFFVEQTLFRSTVSLSNTTVLGDLLATSAMKLSGAVQSLGNASVGLHVSVASNMSVGTLQVMHNLEVDADAYANRSTSVTQDAFAHSVFVSNSWQVQGDLIVSGSVQLHRNLTVLGLQTLGSQNIFASTSARFIGLENIATSDFNGSLVASSALQLSGALQLQNVSFLQSVDVFAMNTTNLSVFGDVISNAAEFALFGSMDSLSDVRLHSGAVSGRLAVLGNGLIMGELAINSSFAMEALVLNHSIAVSGAAMFSPAVVIGGPLLVHGIISNGNAVFGGSAFLSKDLHAASAYFRGMTACNSLSGSVALLGSVVADGNVVVQSNVSLTNGILDSEALVISSPNLPSLFKSSVVVLGNVSASCSDVCKFHDVAASAGFEIQGFAMFGNFVSQNAVVIGSTSASSAVLNQLVTLSSPVSLLTLFVVENCTLGPVTSSRVNAAAPAIFGSSMTATGNLLVQSSASLADNMYVLGPLTAASAVIEAPVTVQAAASVTTSRLVSQFAVVLNLSTSITGTLGVNGVVRAGGDAVFRGVFNVSGAIDVLADCVVRDSVSTGRILAVTGNGFVSTDLLTRSINVGAAMLSKTLSVTGNVVASGASATSFAVASILQVSSPSLLLDTVVLGSVQGASVNVFGNLTVQGQNVDLGVLSVRPDLYAIQCPEMGFVGRSQTTSFGRFFSLAFDSVGRASHVSFLQTLRIDSTGAVGVNVSVNQSPRLQTNFPFVIGNTSSVQLRVNASISDNSMVVYFGQYGGAQHVLSYAAISGNFGIGRMLPLKKLHIAGNVIFVNTSRLADSGLITRSSHGNKIFDVWRIRDYFNVSSAAGYVLGDILGDLMEFRLSEANKNVSGGIVFENVQSGIPVPALTIHGFGRVSVNLNASAGLYATHILDVSGNGRLERPVLANSYVEPDFQLGNRVTWKSNNSLGNNFDVMMDAANDFVFFRQSGPSPRTTAFASTAGVIGSHNETLQSSGARQLVLIIRASDGRISTNGNANPIADVDVYSLRVQQSLTIGGSSGWLNRSSYSTLFYHSDDPSSAIPTADGVTASFYTSTPFWGLAAASSLLFNRRSTGAQGVIGFAMTGSDGAVDPSLVVSGIGSPKVGLGTASPTSALHLSRGHLTLSGSGSLRTSSKMQMSSTLSSTRGFAAHTLIMNPASHASRTASLASAAGRFTSGTYVAGTPSAWGAGANLLMSTPSVASNLMRISFASAFHRAPICTAQLSGAPFFLQVDPSISYVDLYLYSPASGSNAAWTSSGTVDVSIQCIGVL